jgi:hypothetical protein
MLRFHRGHELDGRRGASEIEAHALYFIPGFQLAAHQIHDRVSGHPPAFELRPNRLLQSVAAVR